MKFLDLTYYNNRDFIFPEYLKPTISSNFQGIQNYYLDLSESKYGDIVFQEFHENKDFDLIEQLVDEHGIFFEKFLAAKFRHRIHPLFNHEEKSNYLIESCRAYYNVTGSRNNIISRLKEDFLKISLLRLNSESLYKKLRNSELEKSEYKECAICNKHYKPLKLPEWVYYGSNGNDTICFECPIDNKSKKQEIKKLINELIETLNFIPNADFNPINHNFSSRVNKEKWVDVCKIIFKIGIRGSDSLNSNSIIIKKKFGSWFKALFESNVLPNGIFETPRGFRCVSKSGNECNSLDEMFIDNWLYENKIIAQKEPLYPKHPIYNKSGRRRADWKVDDWFIEYFGLKGEETYDKKTEEKLLLVEDLNLKIISIFPSDLNAIGEKLEILFKKPQPLS